MSPLDTLSRAGVADAESTVSYAPGHAVACPATLTRVVHERRLRKVLELIESQPARSVSQLALEVHLSPAHLQRLFKQETGANVGDVLVEHRLQSAALLLSSSYLTIKEIGRRVGYEHHSSFVRAFHRRFAQAPRDYREQSYRVERDAPELAEKAAAD
jgi:AraC-like DNA-binding protein